MRNQNTQNARKWIKTSCYLVGLAVGITAVHGSSLVYADESKKKTVEKSQKEVPLKISKETTLITEPLKSNGKEVDYFRAIELRCYPKNMKTDENGYRRIVRVLGVSPENDDPELIKQTYEKLGLDPSTKPTITFEGPYDFFEKHIENLPGPLKEEERIARLDELQKKLEMPWTTDELPVMAEWLQNNEPALDLIVKAARQPHYVYPKLRYNEDALILCTLLPETQRQRSFARALEARANYRITQGDLDGAIEDILACKVLGRRIGFNGTLIDTLVGVSIETVGARPGIAGNLAQQPTEAQLHKLLDPLIDASAKTLPTRITVDETLIFEHYTTLDILQSIAVATPEERSKMFKDLGSDWKQSMFFSALDWNLVMKKVNEVYSGRESMVHFKPSVWDYLRLGSRSYRSEYFGNYFIALMLPAVDAFEEVMHRMECNDHMYAITLAMLVYEKQHGTLPPAWTADKNGKPLHSWRVLLLPYLGKEAKRLYEKIRLDEPWDSEHNRQFHDAAIPFYQCPSAKLEPGQTVYTVVVGKKTAFRGDRGVKLDEFGPNSANLLLVTERKTPEGWMNPNAEVRESDYQTQIGSIHSGLILAGFRSGSLRIISDEVLEDTILDRLDQEPTPGPFPKLLDGTASDCGY